MRQERFFRAVAVAAALFFAGCAASIAANKKSPGVLEKDEFKPIRPAQANYGPDPTLTCPERGNNGAVQDALNERLKDKAPRQDGRLCAIADTLLGWPTGERNELPPEAVRVFLSQYFGLPAAVRQLQITVLDTSKSDEVATALADGIADFAANATAPRWGLITELQSAGGSNRNAMVTGSPGGKTHLALVLYDENIALDPLPRKLAPNTSATLSGRLLGSLKSPKVQVVDPLGKLEKSAPPEGQAFRAEIKCGDKPGKILVQVLADLDGADVLAANVPIACGTEPPVAVRVPGKGGPPDPAQAEQKLTEALNADRVAVGLKPLAVHPALNNIARGIAEGRAKQKNINSVELMQQLKEADIATPLILVSEAQSYDVESVHGKLIESPSDRANAMRTDITDLGIGAARGPDIGGKPTIIVTEVFVTQLAPPDPEAIQSKLYQAIAKKRQEAGKPVLEKDATLGAIAQKYAETAVASGGQVPKDKEVEIMSPLYKASMTVNVLGGYVPNEETALSVANQPSVLGDAKLVGVGVAVGRSPNYGKNSPFVMVLLGTRHAPAKATRKKK
jgi:uncharacterized protein YkwD